jgi:hypothetical protein
MDTRRETGIIGSGTRPPWVGVLRMIDSHVRGRRLPDTFYT